MRRTHSSLLKELQVDPHVRAEQMGHTNRRERERLYNHVTQAPQGSCECSGEGNWRLMDSIGLWLLERSL